jgi:folate-binding protein YgfZ
MTDRGPFWAVVDRDVIQVQGPDAISYLHGQASQDLAALAVGDSAWTLLLEPTGKIVVLARAWRTADDTVVLDTDPGFGDVLRARLERFKIRVKADIETLPWTSLAVVGPDETDGDVVGWWGIGNHLLGAGPTPPEGIDEGSADDVEWARVTAGWPAMGTEITPGETIPAETGLAAVAVNFRKGCYPGQELVERMDSRGASAPRHLVRLTVAAGTAPGDPIVHEGAEVGTITSVAGTIALSYVRRGIELGTPVGPA